MDEPIILRDIAAGSEKAFRELYEQYRNKIFYSAYKMLKSADAAEDVLQDIFIKIWQNRVKLGEIENFNAYLNVMIRNNIYNRLRKQANEELFIRSAILNRADNENNFTLHSVLLKETQSRLRKAILELPPQQRKAFELSRFEGKKHEEIALMMNISKETVKKHIMAASGALKTLFDSELPILICALLLQILA